MWNSICKTSDSDVLQVNKNRMYFYLVQQQQLCCEKTLWCAFNPGK